MPPKVSLRVRSGVSTLRGEEFGIVNRVDGILETKYKLDEVLDFLGITEEEWNEKAEGSTIEKDENTGENICKVVTDNKDEIECISGDIKFEGFEDVDMLSALCHDETPSANKERVAKYKVCDCGKWIEESETLTASPVKVGNEWVYTWTFNKAGEIRTISETIKTRVKIDVCTTAIGEMVPKDIEKTIPSKDGSAYQPSFDNSKYMACPTEGIKIPVGMKFVVHPNYVPPNSANRYLDWESTKEDILKVDYNKVTEKENIVNHPINYCKLNKKATNCLFTATITAKEVGTAFVNVNTTRNQTASCKVEVFDGNVDSVSCENKTLNYKSSGAMKRSYSPQNSIYIDFKWSISNSSIATINENSGVVVAKKTGTATVTITAPNGKTGTCTLKVKPKPPSDDGGGGGGGRKPCTGRCCGCSCNNNVPQDARPCTWECC